jgi:peptidoglycan/LPS O-acetylase OafA/YrhL
VIVVGVHTAMTLLEMPEYAVFAISPLGWSLGCAWVVHRAAGGIRGFLGMVLRARVLVYLGTISYGIYLFHPFVLTVMGKVQYRLGFDLTTHIEGGWREFVTVMLLSSAAAAISWQFFERPINLLKKHFPYTPDSRSAIREVTIPVP